MKVSIIGAGAIGSAVAKSLAESRIFELVIATRRHVEKIRHLENIGIKVTDNNKEAAQEADVVIVCVKPKDIKGVLNEIRRQIRGKLVISMAAAVSLRFLKETVPHAKFVRVMPNLAVLVRESLSAYCVDDDVSEDEKRIVEKILGAFGRCVEIREEEMDVITALSGCAPGYLSFLMEAILEACVGEGLPRELASAAIAQSLIGTGKLILEAGLSASEIVRRVATPGGVTEEELRIMRKNRVAEGVKSAIKAGIMKSKGISEDLNWLISHS
jgi:pyrroline-5-carboxylate reductase